MERLEIESDSSDDDIHLIKLIRRTETKQSNLPEYQAPGLERQSQLFENSLMNDYLDFNILNDASLFENLNDSLMLMMHSVATQIPLK